MNKINGAHREVETYGQGREVSPWSICAHGFWSKNQISIGGEQITENIIQQNNVYEGWATLHFLYTRFDNISKTFLFEQIDVDEL